MGILNKFLAFPNISTAKHFAALGAPILFTVGIFLAIETLVVPIFSTKVNQSQTETLPEVAAQVSCIDRVLARVNPQPIDLTAYRNVWDLCGLEGFNALSLEDFRIRREKFLRQELDERVTLALVVGITISGVVMAGLQLFMSYKLAQTGHTELAKDIELSVQQGRIALKSSVIGLAILVISLAFFVVYVKWIYTIEEVRSDGPKSQSQMIGRELPVSGALRADPGRATPLVSEPSPSP